MLEKYFTENEELILSELNKSEYKNTAKVFLNFYEKSRSISYVVNNLDFEKSYYPCLILIRSQIEHFIVTSYIWSQFQIQENDSIASIYYKEYLIQEIIKRLNFSKQNKISPSSRYAIIFQEILDILTNNKIISQKDIEKINIKANQFDIKRISKFFDDKVPKEIEIFFKPEHFKQYLEYYNYFSSIVHGGPSSDAFIIGKDKKYLTDSMIEFQEWSKNITGIHRFYVIYFLAMKNDKIKSDLNRELKHFFKMHSTKSSRLPHQL